MADQRRLPAADGLGAEEASRLGELTDLARTVTPADRDLVTPPAGLWDRIAEAAGVATAPERAGPGRSEADQPVGGGREAGGPAVAPLGRRRRPRRRLVLTAAAAAAVAAGLVVGAFVVDRRGDDATELATAQLSGVGLDPRGADSGGTATLVRRDGRTELELRVDDLPDPASGYLEVWLLDAGGQGLVSLGPWRGDGAYLVPAGVDPGRFPLVDISDERPDGNPGHGGVSLVRGQLV